MDKLFETQQLRSKSDKVKLEHCLKLKPFPPYTQVMENEPFEDVFPIEHGDISVSYVSFPQKKPIIWQFLLQLLDIHFFFTHQKNQAMWSG